MRTKKPRQLGITAILDKGISAREAEDMLCVGADHIDYIKLGWGTALVTSNLEDKLTVYRQAGIPVLLGGTYFEYCLIRDELNEFKRTVDSYGFDHIEISDGTIELNSEEKLRLIREFSKNYTVFSEVGSKDLDNYIPPRVWIESMNAELEAGAKYVIAEARELGRGGICRTNGELRFGLIDEIVSSVPFEKIIFEAPNRDLQVWFVRHLGANVNVANIYPDDLIGLETLRLGLRSDTLLLFHEDRKNS